MLLAVDWSGDPGVKPGSLPRCVMAVVACEDEAALASALMELRQVRSVRKDFEFHYTDIDEARALRKVLHPALSKALGERGIVERLDKMAPGSSEKYDALQLTDMVGGAVSDAVKRRGKKRDFWDQHATT